MHPTLTSSVETTLVGGVCCALCGAGSRRLHPISGYWIRECKSCRHRFAELDSRPDHIERVYSDDYFFGGGAGYSDYLSEERLLVDRGRWYAQLLRRYCQPGAVLDIGAAGGFTLRGLSAAGWQCFGVEPNAAQAQYARNHFGFDVAASPLESWTPSRTFDLVTMLQVLPHFLEPKQALLKAASLLEPGGLLLIETWDRDSWTARLMGKHWHEYSPPSVLHWFTKRGLRDLAANCGLDFVAQGRPAKWIDAGHAKSLLRSKSQDSIANRLLLQLAKLIPDRAAIPYPAEDLFWLLLRGR